MDSTLTAYNEGNPGKFSLRISDVLGKSMLFLVDKTLNLKKVSSAIDDLTQDIQSHIEQAENLETNDLREFYLEMSEIKDLLEPFNSIVGIAKTEAKSLRANFGLLIESLEDFAHYSILLVEKLENELNKREIDENSEDFKEFLTDLVSLTDKCEITSSGASVDDLFK